MYRLIATACASIVLAVPAIASAQGASKIKAAGSYSYLKDGDDTSNIGATADVMYKFFESATHVVVGGVGEFGFNRFVDTTAGDFNRMQYMGGVRFTSSRAARFMPFGQFLVGVQRCCSDFNAATFQPGGGVDMRFLKLFGKTVDLRVQADLPIQRYNGGNYRQFRGSVGIAVPIK